LFDVFENPDNSDSDDDFPYIPHVDLDLDLSSDDNRDSDADRDGDLYAANYDGVWREIEPTCYIRVESSFNVQQLGYFSFFLLFFL